MLKGFYVASAGATTIPSTSPNLIHIDRFGIREIDGIGRPESELYTTELVGTDASAYSGQTVKSRTITLSVDAQDEYSMRALYKQFPYNMKRRLIFETEYDTYFIDGIARGMPRTQGISNRAEFEIPIFCPYPWFRSLRPHTQDFVFGNAVTITQDGDIRAGVRIYATLDVTEKLTNFSVRDETGNKVTYNSDVAYLPVAKAKRLLIDTTPGAHAFLRLKDVQNIKIENDWVTVPVGEDTTITTSINAVGAGGTIEWYDTWGGI